MNELARTGPGAAAAPAVLGKDKALAPNGAVGQKKTVQLWEQQGHIFWTGSKKVKTQDANGNVIDKWMSVYSLDIKGLDLLNQTAGCTVIPAPFLVVDGRECENPRIIRGESNQPAEVISKYVCFGLSKSGQPAVSISTVALNIKAYEAYTWFNAWSGKLKQGKVTNAKRHMGELKVIDAITKKEHQSNLIVDLMNGMALVIDPTKEDAIAILKQLINFRLTCAQRVETKARRRAMQSHPAFGVQQIVGNGQSVEAFAWSMTPESKAKLDQISQAVSEGRLESIHEVGGVEVFETEHTFEEDEEPVEAEFEEVTEEEEKAEAKEEEPKKEKAPSKPAPKARKAKAAPKASRPKQPGLMDRPPASQTPDNPFAD
ncbi:MAG: hypothetical protein DWQ01_08535 [Planctomycetota bacterium]|nr:MAG: hypothetical protein DWQ01_08535 [Planctomycetota bacterium]